MAMNDRKGEVLRVIAILTYEGPADEDVISMFLEIPTGLRCIKVQVLIGLLSLGPKLQMRL